MLKTFYGSRLQLVHQPDLSLHTQTSDVLLDRNDMRVVYRELLPPNIKILNLSLNRIYSDGLIEDWPDSIESLDLTDNRIVDTLGVYNWPLNLSELFLDTNPLEKYPDNLPINLKVLSMSYCDLKTLYSLPDNIKKLIVFYNKLKKVGTLPKSLEYCNMAYNYLTSHSVFSRPLPNLTYLNLSYNNLTWLPNHLPDSLETLIVNNNSISKFPRILPRNLIMLSASHNKIQDFSIDWKSGQYLRLLYIQDNCLIKNLLHESRIERVYQNNNWNEQEHNIYVGKVQRTFRHYKFKKGVRNWRRFRIFRNELCEVAMNPDFVNRWDEVESWKQWKH